MLCHLLHISCILLSLHRSDVYNLCQADVVVFFFPLTWPLTHLCLFSFNTADGNSYQVSMSFFFLFYILVILLPVCFRMLKRLIIVKSCEGSVGNTYVRHSWAHSLTLHTGNNNIKSKCRQLRFKNAAQTEPFTWAEWSLLSRHACCQEIKSVILVLINLSLVLSFFFSLTYFSDHNH